MSEENQIAIEEKKNTDIKTLLLNNKKTFISIFIILLILFFSYFFYLDFNKKNQIEISERYNLSILAYEKNSIQSINEIKNIIEIKNPTYSPLALYFLLDNNLLKQKNEINKYFDILINETKLDKEIKNLIIYKKGLYNSGSASEEELLNIFKPLINNDNLWKSHSLFVLAEYFFSKNEKQKSKEFFKKILEMDNSNPQIKMEAQKRLQRDFSV